MKSQIILLCLLNLCCFLGFSQSYNTTMGIRMGTDWGLTVQQRILKRLTLEGIIQSSTRRDEVLITGILEKHFPILTKRFNVYYGAGLHKGWIEQPLREEDAIPNPFGITLIAGGEFTLFRVNVSYDFKPIINIQGTDKFLIQSGVSLRYVLNKKKKQAWEKKSKRKRNKKKGKRMNKNSSWKFWKN